MCAVHTTSSLIIYHGVYFFFCYPGAQNSVRTKRNLNTYNPTKRWIDSSNMWLRNDEWQGQISVNSWYFISSFLPIPYIYQHVTYYIPKSQMLLQIIQKFITVPVITNCNFILQILGSDECWLYAFKDQSKDISHDIFCVVSSCHSIVSWTVLERWRLFRPN